MKYKKTISVAISLVGSYFVAYPVGHWYAKHGGAEYGWIYFGPFPGYFGGFLFSYAFLSVLLVSLFSGKIKYGFYSALPVLFLAGFDYSDPWAGKLLIFFLAGLALAWIILFVKSKLNKS